MSEVARVEAAQTTREAVGIFQDENKMLEAIDDLETHGFNRYHISVLASKKTVEAKLGRIYKRVEELADNPNVPRDSVHTPEYIGHIEGSLFSYPIYIAATAATTIVVASGGTLLSAITAAIAAGMSGGLIGGLLAYLVGKHHSDYLQEQIERGGLLLWISVSDEQHERIAISVLNKYSAQDIHIHNIPVAN